MKKIKLRASLDILIKQKRLPQGICKFAKYLSSLKLNNGGFSLTELVAVIAIIGIMAAITVPQYAKYRDDKALILGANQLLNDVRMTQNYTYSTLKFNSYFPSGGYGIRFEKGSNGYIIFADLDEDKEYDSLSEKFEEEDLPGDVKIKSIKIDAVDSNSADLVFVPPYGKVYINKHNKNGSSFIDLEIEITNSTNSKTISVRSSGLIK